MVNQARVVKALNETQQMLEKLENKYTQRPEHLRTLEDSKLINFYRNHVAKLTSILLDN